MPWNSEHKTQSKEKILESAAGLFTSQGYAGVSIDQIMRNANLTRGAFYAHFKSKADVYHQSILYAARYARDLMEAGDNNPTAIVKQYLAMGESSTTEETRQAGRDYCPLACLISDIAQQEHSVKQTYTQVLKGFQTYFESKGLSENAAIQITTQLIGALALSNAVTDTDLKHTLLKNAQSAVERLIIETNPLGETAPA